MAAISRLDPPAERKARGAFFTPPAIAEFLTRWALDGRSTATLLDPSCGDGVFLLSGAEELVRLGCSSNQVEAQLHGVDIHEASLDAAAAALKVRGLAATLRTGDFFALAAPGDLFGEYGPFDAVVGNPPFIRYQNHSGAARRASRAAASRQGVELSGLASSWAALLIHAAAFLKPQGRLGLVLPAELLTVGYAEPVRAWLKSRFASVTLIMFDELQFADALEHVVLVLAQGTGGCEGLTVHSLTSADQLEPLASVHPTVATSAPSGKWTHLLVADRPRALFERVVEANFVDLGAYGSPTLGTVTGANHFFTLSDSTRTQYGLDEGTHVRRISPPGTRHLRGAAFRMEDWEALRDAGEPVWILCPPSRDVPDEPFQRYLEVGLALGIDRAYKCRVREPWWRPPVVPEPDIFFTYMSHRYPRLVTNEAGVTFVNSMHGIRLRPDASVLARRFLPIAAMNSVTMLGAELRGRSYGGGILKMEPREAASLPVPSAAVLETVAWRLGDEARTVDRQLRGADWRGAVSLVDEILLGDILGLSGDERTAVVEAAQALADRRMRTRSTEPRGGDQDA